jgi:hypothetical protein
MALVWARSKGLWGAGDRKEERHRQTHAGPLHTGAKAPMTTATPILIEARTDPAEQSAVIAGAEQLSEHLALAIGGQPWLVRLNFSAPGAPLSNDAPHVIITSMLPETARLTDPMAVVEARWRADLERLTRSGAVVFICTVFRRLPDRAKAGTPSPLLERIRQLNRLTLELSQAYGVGVLDFDRDLAHVGARFMDTDYRLGGVLGAEVAGHTMAWGLLSFGLDEAVEPETQEKAKALLGGMQTINRLINRRLAARRARQTALSAAAPEPSARG